MFLFGSNQMYLRPKKRLGQNFLISERIARAEAAHADGRNVIELGAGYGILTKELCKHASLVVSFETDKNLFTLLKTEIRSKKLVLINKDFFEATPKELMLGTVDIMISNIPYNLSSKSIDFLIKNKMEAVLCLQKEFVEHMLAKQGEQKYSRLSVVSQLFFSLTKIMDAKRGNFRPMPGVDSSIIYLRPKQIQVGEEELRMIGLLMQHKKKTVKRALSDSSFYIGQEKRKLYLDAEKLSRKDERVFKLSPQELLELAREIIACI